MNRLLNFIYKDKKGKVTDRTVYTVHPASDNMLAIDLTEFDDNERGFYTEQLSRLDDMVKQEIKELGLNGNYRNFKREAITPST